MTLDITDIPKRLKVAKEIAKTQEAIRKKCRALKTGKIDEDIQLERQYKPIVEPLMEIIAKTSENDSLEDDTILQHENKKNIKRKLFSETITPIKTPRISNITDHDDDADNDNYHDAEDETSQKETLEEQILQQPLNVEETEKQISQQPLNVEETNKQISQQYMQQFRDNDKSIDRVYGVRDDRGKDMIGNSLFKINKNSDIIIKNELYPGTRGLYELLFKKIPDSSICTKTDWKNYKQLLIATSAHKCSYQPYNAIKRNKGRKYTEIIAPLFQSSVNYESIKTGKGATKKTKLPLSDMTLTNNDIDYVYWDDPNELVDRLRLLVASKEAGNNNHNNEIISIIEELRERGIILN